MCIYCRGKRVLNTLRRKKGGIECLCKIAMGFPWWLVVKEATCAGNMGLIPYPGGRLRYRAAGPCTQLQSCALGQKPQLLKPVSLTTCSAPEESLQ